MSNKVKSTPRRGNSYRIITSFLGSNKFLWIVILLFFLEATWLAFTANHGVLFDEKYHYQLIKLYAHQFSPFLSSQPTSLDANGALIAEPSFFYHFIMSFPYRIFHFFNNNDLANIVFLRMIGISFVASGFVLFQKLLLRANFSGAYSNLILLFTILIPTVPAVSGTIDYDALVFPIVAGTLLLATDLIRELKNSNRVNLSKLALLFGICMIGSVTKYAFLPIFLAITLFISIYILIALVYNHKEVFSNTLKKIHSLKSKAGILSLIFLVVGSGLFIGRYAFNKVKYGAFIPSCSEVLNVNRCSKDILWVRNETLSKSQKLHPAPIKSTMSYTIDWSKIMYHQLFSISNETKEVFIIAEVAKVMFVISFLLFLVYLREIIGQSYALKLMIFTSILYLATLWWTNYHSYKENAAEIAINARYLFPISIISIAALGSGWTYFLKRLRYTKMVFVAAMFLLCLEGGGISGYILTNGGPGFWNNNKVIEMNTKARNVLKHIIKPIN